MENNTITPNPEPKPQPVAPMPVFGSAVPTPTVTPEAAPTPTLSTSAMPVMSAQPAPTPAAPAASPAPTSVTPANVSPATATPAPATAQATTIPTSPTSTLPDTAPAPATPAASTALAATPAAPAAAGPQVAAEAPAEAPTASAGTSTPAGVPTPAASPASEPATTPVTTPAEQPTTAPAATQPPINKGRLIALIAIIAGLVVAGIIAAVLIVLFANSKPNPIANAEAALANLESPAGTPTSISASVELVSDDDVLASASAVLESSNLFFSYDGVSDLLDSYLGLAAVADQESVSSLLVVSSLLQFAESTWWQVPVEDLTLAAEYRAHPFLVLSSAENGNYHLRIDGDKLFAFLSAFDLDFTTEETNCIDDSADTNCGTGTDLSLLGLTTMPSAEQIKSAVSSIDIIATIDAENRFTNFYTVLGEDEFVVNIKIDLVYANLSLGPEEYRPITELMSQFLQAIGY